MERDITIKPIKDKPEQLICDKERFHGQRFIRLLNMIESADYIYYDLFLKFVYCM